VVAVELAESHGQKNRVGRIAYGYHSAWFRGAITRIPSGPMNELEEARLERDTSFSAFVEESAKATKHSLRAKAASARYMLARDEVRALRAGHYELSDNQITMDEGFLPEG
jgi:hypothetical protein